MAAKKDRFAHVGTPDPAPVEDTAATPPESFEVPYQDTVQLNVNISPALRKAIRLKALQEGVHVTVALRRVLQAWVDGE